MPEPIDRDPHAAAVLAVVLAGHAAALDRLFARTFADILSNKIRSLRDVSRALTAQAQCRTALRLLHALRALERAREKSRNRTNRLLQEDNSHHDQALGQAPSESRSWPGEAPPQVLGLVARAPRPSGGGDPRLATLEKVDGSENERGQDPFRLECAQARLPKSPLHRTGPRGAPAYPPGRPNHRPRQGSSSRDAWRNPSSSPAPQGRACPRPEALARQMGKRSSAPAFLPIPKRQASHVETSAGVCRP